jgi:LysM repeat protein
MFADLGLGMPEARAAFFNGYNGGADQYGRKVTAPFAIDLAFPVADDLGIPARTNEWITVSFMWTDGWGSAPAAPPPGEAGGEGEAGQSLSAVSPVETAAAGADGRVVHEVKAGQTLWGIAVAYGTTVAQLQALNGLGDEAVIATGQKLVVRTGSAGGAGDPKTPEGPAETPGPEARQAERALQRTEAALELSKAAGKREPGVGLLSTQAPGERVDDAALPGGAVDAAGGFADPILLAIAAAAGLGLALVAWGAWIRRGK